MSAACTHHRHVMYTVSRVLHLDIRVERAARRSARGRKGCGGARRGRRNRREEDEASEIRLETSNLPESPASCNYHVCQPTRAPSPGSPFRYLPLRVPHSRPPLSPPRRRRRRFHLSFHPAPSSHRAPPQLAPLSHPSHSTDRPSSRPSNPSRCAPRHPRSRPDETPRHSRRQRLW